MGGGLLEAIQGAPDKASAYNVRCQLEWSYRSESSQAISLVQGAETKKNGRTSRVALLVHNTN